VKQDCDAVAFDPALISKLTETVAAQQSEVPHLFSGAGHDAAVMAAVCPAAMLFVRCRDGLSHHPDEYASPADLAAALEAANLPLAVVPGVAGQTRIWAGFTGKAGHAGTTPMPLRRDALTAAAHMVLATEAYAHEHAPLLATVGRMEVMPGAGNVIPGEVRFSLDVRSPDNAARRTGLEYLKTRGAALAAEHRLTWHWEVKQDGDAVAFDPALISKLTEIVAAQQAQVPHLFSGAGHDAAVMAAVCPAAMLFVRCRDGLSHHPDEYAAPADLAAALEAAVRFMLSLAGESHA